MGIDKETLKNKVIKKYSLSNKSAIAIDGKWGVICIIK